MSAEIKYGRLPPYDNDVDNGKHAGVPHFSVQNASMSVTHLVTRPVHTEYSMRVLISESVLFPQVHWDIQ